jgi:ornithine carbamoyltransferase
MTRTVAYDRAVPRHFLTGEELAPDELLTLIERGLGLKLERSAAVDRLAVATREPMSGGEADASARRPAGALAGRSVALLFERPSTRTRISFEVGVAELGGRPVVLSGTELQLSRGESVRDTALTLSRYVHAIGVRTAAHATVEELAAHSRVPVINMLTRDHHPCQALADLLTLRERFGRLAGLKLAYLGDGNNVSHSLMVLGAAAGLEVAVATPLELAPHPLVAQAAGARARDGGSVTLTQDPRSAASGAHALYTDVWVSMGDEGDAGRRRELLDPYRLDGTLLDRARDDAVALHCLPAHPGEEIAPEVLYGERSLVWDQAENRLHAQKALLELLVE